MKFVKFFCEVRRCANPEKWLNRVEERDYLSLLGSWEICPNMQLENQ